MLPRMTAGLLLGAGLPLFDQLFPPMPLIEQVQNTPLLITAVLMFCLAAAFLALWRAAPDFRAFRTLGIFFAMVAVSQSSDYFGGQTLYWCLRAIASGMLVEAAGEAMQIPRRRWTLLFWPSYLFVSVAVWFPNLSFTADWPMRSEERRVGKEWRSRWSPYHSKKIKKSNHTRRTRFRCGCVARSTAGSQT